MAKSNSGEIEKTGDVRKILANALKGTVNGDMDVERADRAWKIGKTINDSLYSETKIAMLKHQLGQEQVPLGELRIFPEE